jgi:hypothetical protein
MLTMEKQELQIRKPELHSGKHEMCMEKQEDMASGVAYLNKTEICNNFWSRLRRHSRRMRNSSLLN